MIQFEVADVTHPLTNAHFLYKHVLCKTWNILPEIPRHGTVGTNEPRTLLHSTHFMKECQTSKINIHQTVRPF